MLLVLFSVICLWPASSEGSRILISVPYGTKSNLNMYVPLAIELVRRGHNLTVINNFQSSELDEVGIPQIVLDSLAIHGSSFTDAFESHLSPFLMVKSLIMSLKTMFDLPIEITETIFDDKRVQELLVNDHFDLVIFSMTLNRASYALAWHFKAPCIMLTPNSIFPGALSSLGDDEEPSYVPFFMTHFSNQMNLFQRTINTLATNLFVFFIHNWYQPTIRSMVQQRGVDECPPLVEIEKNISIVFTNTHPAINYPRAMPPQIVEIGGIHCRKPNPLPENLESFVSSSPAGFILFGVGSTLPMEIMPEFLIQSFIKAFAKLPQRVVWQWKGKVRDDFPSNVMPIPWLPQQDLLGHKDCRIFMTHGGLNSAQEAIYHGVPLLGLPFGTDQKLNMRRAVNDGYARQLFWNEVSEESLSEAIGDLLHNPSYLEAVQKKSKLFHDQIQTPLERAVFWTEFVIRNNGTEHLHLASRDLSSYQRSLIDVYLVLITCAILPVLSVYLCLKKCWKCKKRLRSTTHKKNK